MKRSEVQAGSSTTVTGFYQSLQEAGMPITMSTYDIIAEYLHTAWSWKEYIKIDELEKDVPALERYNIIFSVSESPRRLNYQREKMKAEKVAPNVWTYALMLKFYHKMNTEDNAMQVYSEFLKSGLEPNAYIYKHLLRSLVNSGRGSDVVNIYETISPKYKDRELYHIAIAGYGFASNNVEQNCNTLIQEMKQDKYVGVSIDTYRLVMEALALNKDLVAAEKIYNEALKETDIIELSLAPTFIECCLRCNEYDKAYKLFEDLKQRGLKNTHLYNTMILLSGSVTDTVELFCQMVQDECIPDETTHENVLKVLEQTGELSQFLEAYEEEFPNQIKDLDHTIATVLVTLYQYDNQYEKALAIYDASDNKAFF